jgi:hypothetical protein
MIVFKVVGAILFTLLMCAAYMSIISAGNWAAVGLCAVAAVTFGGSLIVFTCQ